MDELVRWLGEQLEEDERIAREAPLGPWSVDGAGSIVDADGGRVVPSVGGTLNGRVSRWPEAPAADHILGHDPAQVLREIDAKRRLIDEHDIGNRRVEDCFTMECQSNRFPCTTLRLLALPYADRPGYREDWRP